MKGVDIEEEEEAVDGLLRLVLAAVVVSRWEEFDEVDKRGTTAAEEDKDSWVIRPGDEIDEIELVSLVLGLVSTGALSIVELAINEAGRAGDFSEGITTALDCDKVYVCPDLPFAVDDEDDKAEAVAEDEGGGEASQEGQDDEGAMTLFWAEENEDEPDDVADESLLPLSVRWTRLAESVRELPREEVKVCFKASGTMWMIESFSEDDAALSSVSGGAWAMCDDRAGQVEGLPGLGCGCASCNGDWMTLNDCAKMLT